MRFVMQPLQNPPICSSTTGMSLSPGIHLLITATNMVVVKMTHVTMHQLVITLRGKINYKNKATTIFFKPIALYTHTVLQPMWQYSTAATITATTGGVSLRLSISRGRMETKKGEYFCNLVAVLHLLVKLRWQQREYHRMGCSAISQCAS